MASFATCSVCRDFKSDAKESETWPSMTDRTSISQSQTLFKLYDILKIEFDATGHICKECSGIVEKIESLEVQLKSLTNSLRERVYAEFKSEKDTDYKPEAKRRRTVYSSSSSRKSSKSKPTDVVDEDLENSSEFWRSVGSQNALAKFLNSERLDFNVTMTTTQRGEEQLIFKDHTYKKKVYQPTVLKDGRGIVKWRCTKYYQKSNCCKGQVATTLDGLSALIDSETEHNHPSDPQAVKILMFRERIKEIALNHPDMKTTEILASAEMLGGDKLGGQDSQESLGLKCESLLRFIQRLRAKQVRDNKNSTSANSGSKIEATESVGQTLDETEDLLLSDLTSVDNIVVYK